MSLYNSLRCKRWRIRNVLNGNCVRCGAKSETYTCKECLDKCKVRDKLRYERRKINEHRSIS